MRGSKPNDLAQNQTTRLKTKQEIPVTDSDSEESQGVEETPIEERTVALRAMKPIEDHCDAFRPSLAGARAAGGTPSRAASPTLSASVLAEIKRLNRPNLLVVKKKILKDAFGHPVKRQYIRRPKPDDPAWLEYVDGLTPEEREKYIASFR